MRTALVLVLVVGCASSHEALSDAASIDGGHDAAPDPIDAAIVPVDAAPRPCAADQIVLTGTVGGEDVSLFVPTSRQIVDCSGRGEYRVQLSSATHPDALELFIALPIAWQGLHEPIGELNATVLYTLDGDLSGGGMFYTSHVDPLTSPDGVTVGHLVCDTPDGRIEGTISIGYCDFSVCL